MKKNITGIDARMIGMSGIGTYIQHLMGCGIYDYAVGNKAEIQRYDKEVKVIPFDASIYRAKEQLLFPVREIKKAGITLMHFPHYNVPVCYHGRYVVTVHDLTHIIMPEFLGSRIKYYYAKFLMGKALRRADYIFTVSENSKKDIINYFRVEDSKIGITYNAVDSDFRARPSSETDYLYRKYHISKSSKKILYVGNLKPHKNITVVLKAIKSMDRKDVILILAGKDFNSTDLKKQEIEMGIADQVIHTGVVSKDELICLYSFADVFVFPSLYEGFGLPPLEAMACGTPVVAANNSSIPEILGNAALFADGYSPIEFAAKINELIDSVEYRELYIKRGIERNKFYSWSTTRNTVEKVLRGTDLSRAE